MTRKVREMPYFETPCSRAWWVTAISPIRELGTTPATQAGMKRCISPISFTCLMIEAR
ncbi:hypothetical protein ACVMIX_002913 [Rhizobium leguminosarum]